MNYNISMGIWHSQPGIKTQTGISQNIARHNYVDTLSQHDKVMNPIHKEGKQIEPRLLPESAIAAVCCVDTPEGEAAGFQRSRPQYVHQAIGSSPEPIVRILLDETRSGLRLMFAWDELLDEAQKDPGLSSSNQAIVWNVFINQILVGFTVRPDALLSFLRRCRRKCMVSQDLSCSYEMLSSPWDIAMDSILDGQSMEPQNEDFDEWEPYLNPLWRERAMLTRKYRIDIRTHSGRIMREVFVVENLYKLHDMYDKVKTLFKEDDSPISLVQHQDLLVAGIVEYIDVAESQDCLIAIEAKELQESCRLWQDKYPEAFYPASKRTNTYSHVEIHPSMIFGLSAAMIAFPQCNPPARLAFSAHMKKHAQGKANMISKMDRMPTNYNEKWYAERSTVSTDVSEALGEYRLSVMTDHEIAICCGPNEEDSQQMNASIAELGYFASSTYHLMTTQEHRHKNKVEKIGFFPSDQCSGYKIECNYKLLDENGIIRPGSLLAKNTVLVQKCIDQKDVSLVYRSSKSAEVDRVFSFRTDQGLLVVNVIVRETRLADEGDKNASDHAQKGVISKKTRRENMFFNVDSGNFPDIVYNSTAFPSRLTYAMYIVMLICELAAFLGGFVNATAFMRNWTRLLVGIPDDLKDNGLLIECISEARRIHGLHPFGSHSVIDARTGKRASHNARVFSGFRNMQKLKQMGIDKLRSRGTGSKKLCHQAADGL